MSTIEHSSRVPSIIPIPETGERLNQLIDEAERSKIISRVAENIYKKHGTEEIVLIGILMGGDTTTVLLSEELARLGNFNVLKGYIAIKSYEDEQSNKQPEVYARIIKFPLKGKRVIVVDTIAESNFTALAAWEYLSSDSPESLETCAVFVKDEKGEIDFKFDYVGVTIPGEKWFAGSGPDGKKEKHRHLPGIYYFT